MRKKLDEQTVEILKVLFKNSRASFVEISKLTGIPFSTVRYKIQNLTKSNFIKKFTIIVDPEKIKISSALLLIKTDGQTDEVIKKCKELHNSAIVASLIGTYDIFMEVIGKSLDELKELTDRIKNFPHVSDVAVSVVIKWDKWDFPADLIG
ncbi:MAG: Lrp/AsnC family transcriptional regulator [Candidatus Asgardarchaeia archaeon]